MIQFKKGPHTFGVPKVWGPIVKVFSSAGEGAKDVVSSIAHFVGGIFRKQGKRSRKKA